MLILSFLLVVSSWTKQYAMSAYGWILCIC